MTKIPNPSLISDKSYVSESPNSEPKWYAVYTRSRFEKKLYHDLQKAKIQAFLPMIKEKRKWSDRLKTILMPLLPSYVFVKMPQKNLQQIYYYPGVVRLVSFEGKPCEIKEDEIGLLEKIVAGEFNVQCTTNCGVGDVVQIIRGPLAGWEGKIERLHGQSRVVFQFECIQQSLSVEINREDIQLALSA